jgi:DNA-binding transcriptional MerR regulator
MAVAEKIVPSSTRPGLAKPLPAIPAKRYFTIGEVSDLCQVKPYVLRYWEQEFTQLKPMKRRGNRRYYQHHEVLLIRRIRDLLYDQGFTISGARNRLGDVQRTTDASVEGVEAAVDDDDLPVDEPVVVPAATERPAMSPDQLRIELLAIRRLLAS